MARGCWSSVALAIAVVLVAAVSSPARAAIVEHTFDVGNMSISQMCLPEMTITAVNGQLPGTTIEANEGDTVVVHLINNSPYNMTIHWHGIFQRGSQWADGPAMVTQCPLKPGGGNYTYRFNVTGQEGTLWYHSHNSILRATVYGALIIKPRNGSYPFSPKPDGEMVVMIGEWWNANVYELHETKFLNGDTVPAANAYTINGRTGDMDGCSGSNTTTDVFKVRRNETYLVRIINAALNTPHFVKVANHSFTVVAADACYTTPYKTDVVVVFPGQTVDVLMVADAAPGRRYYMTASPYDSADPSPPEFLKSTATAIVEYVGAGGENATTTTPVMPVPAVPMNDTATAHGFLSNLTALVLAGRPSTVPPLVVDTRMFVTVGLGESDCMPDQTNCTNPPPKFSSSMNNASFVLPKGTSMLEAHYSNNTAGVYTRDFPDTPPLVFNYTSNTSDTEALRFTTKSTKVRTLRYNETVEMVMQNTRLVAREAHPMHLHGSNFFVLAQGFGNYNATEATPQFNLVNPQERNTVAVPTGGWAVIRFVADNPGMWYMHCHFDAHLDLGLGMIFEVQDGPTPATSVPPPPQDLPKC